MRNKVDNFHSWQWSEFTKMAIMTRFLRGHFSLCKEVDQFGLTVLHLCQEFFWFTTESLTNPKSYEKPWGES